jgi:hypothetical protein
MSSSICRGNRKRLNLSLQSLKLVAAVTLLANGAAAAFAGETATNVATADPAPPAAGVRAFIDPRTGQPTSSPSPEQLQRLSVQARAATLSRSVEGLRTFELQRGGRGLNLQGRFQTALRVERAADGSFRASCGDGETIAGANAHQHHHHADIHHASGSPSSELASER